MNENQPFVVQDCISNVCDSRYRSFVKVVGYVLLKSETIPFPLDIIIHKGAIDMRLCRFLSLCISVCMSIYAIHTLTCSS